MIQFSAAAVIDVALALEHLNTEGLIDSMVVDPSTPIFNPGKPLNPESVRRLQQIIAGGEAGCRRLGLNITAGTISELGESLKDPTAHRNYQWIKDQIRMLQGLMHKEMSGKVFVYIPPEKAAFFTSKQTPFLFGEAVNKAFPSAYFDIAEAGACIATTRPTASVFHVMRVFEIGLTALGSVFGVSLAHTNWAPALDEIESKIRNMRRDPAWSALADWKEQQELYAQAASHFGILKDAWRNYTMHTRGKYTEEEAEHIFRNAKKFMQKLAERLHE